MVVGPNQEQVQTPRVQVPRTTVERPERRNGEAPEQPRTVISLQNVNVYYGDFHAVTDVNYDVRQNAITAFIGPSGCGKSTVLRCINRMNDLVPSARVEGRIEYHGQDINARNVDPVEVRRRIGMVFQRPNPFPKSIYE